MKGLVTTALLLLLLLAVLPVPLAAHAQTAPKIAVSSQYIIDRYGFATINETVRFTNNESSAVQVPSMTFGFGNLSSVITASSVTGNGFALTPSGSSFTIASSLSLQSGANASFVFSALVSGIASRASNGSILVLTLSTPSVSPKVDSLFNVVVMPATTTFRTVPLGLTASIGGTNNTYWSKLTEVAPTAAVTSVRAITSSAGQDFHPLRIYSAQRTITAASDGTPLVTDEVEFQNIGSTPLTLLYVNLLASQSTKVTILAVTEPRLFNTVTLPLNGGAIDLSLFAVGYPTNGVRPGANFTLTYQYPLGSNHYSVSGGKVTLTIPDTPPVRAFVDAYTISLSLPEGAVASQSTPATFGSPGNPVSPLQGGTTQFAYSLSVGWAVNSGVPLASVVFLMLLVGLFAARTTTAEAEGGEEEESSTELAADMIKAFEEKTILINGLWQEIAAKDPNEVDKEYFDEIRGRLDTFRSKALQRLNEVKQKSASQRFFEVVNQIQTTEREVDRAARDKLNLYQQYYLRQMRKEVYDRLLPQYTKRLEKALNQLSDELHTVQREAKLL